MLPLSTDIEKAGAFGRDEQTSSGQDASSTSLWIHASAEVRGTGSDGTEEGSHWPFHSLQAYRVHRL